MDNSGKKIQNNQTQPPISRCISKKIIKDIECKNSIAIARIRPILEKKIEDWVRGLAPAGADEFLNSPFCTKPILDDNACANADDYAEYRKAAEEILMDARHSEIVFEILKSPPAQLERFDSYISMYLACNKKINELFNRRKIATDSGYDYITPIITLKE
jgi:hypothetical protein